MIFNAGVTFICGDSVILAKRVETWKGKKVPFGGYWSPFAGAIEKNENPMAAAIRELKEETGVERGVHELKYVGTYKEEGRSFTFYLIEVDNLPQIKLNEEHTEHGVFRISALNTLPERVDPKVMKGLKDYITRRDGGINLSEK